MLATGALLLAFSGCSKSKTPSSAPAQAPASESLALTQEQIAAEVARQVAEQLAAAGVKETSQPPAKEAALGGAAELSPSRAVENVAADKPHVWAIGGAAPNGGLVYFAQDGEFYEAMAPANTVGLTDSLPAGWSAPDMEDLGLIYAGLQKTGAADYGAVYYYSVSKTGGKNRFLRMSDGKEAAGVTVGRKVGVRKFDPAQPPAQFDKAVLVYTPSQAEKAAANTAAPAPAATVAPAPAQTPAKPAPAPAPAAKYAIGDKGPGGGVVFAAAGGTFKEVSPIVGTIKEFIGGMGWSAYLSLILDPVKAYQSNGFSGWSLPSWDELKQIYELQKSGKVKFEGLILSKTGVKGNRHSTPDLAFGNADFPGFPGYRVILAAGGSQDTYYALNFSTGEHTVFIPDVYIPDVGDRYFSFVAVRSFK